MSTVAPLAERIGALLGEDPAHAFRKWRNAIAKASEVRGQIAEKRKELAPLEAWFETRGMNTSGFDASRKVKLASIVEEERAAAREKGRKVTDGALDTFAHASPEYRRWIDDQQARRMDMHIKRAELAALEGELRTWQDSAAYWRAQTRKHEEWARVARAEMGMER